MPPGNDHSQPLSREDIEQLYELLQSYFGKHSLRTKSSQPSTRKYSEVL